MRAPYLLTVLTMAAASCAPAMSGKARPHVAAGYAALREGKPIEANNAFTRAKAALASDPDESLVDAIDRGVAEVDRLVIEKAVDAETKLAGDDEAHLRELHRIHGRLLQIGGNAQLEARIVEGMKLRADLILAPHEKSPVPTDLAPLRELLTYPELPTETIATRIRALEVKAWRLHTDRAAESKHALVRRIHQGLAAKLSGTAIEDATALAKAELAPYARASNVTVSVTPDCAGADQSVLALRQPGTARVDADVRISNCTSTQETEWFDVKREEYNEVPYESTEQVPYQSCTTQYSDGGCAVFAGTQGCAVRSYTAYPVCTVQYETRTVTRYQRVLARSWTEKQSRTVSIQHADLSWTRKYEGQSTPLSSKVSGKGSFGELAAGAIRVSLDEPVRASLDAKRTALIAEAQQSLTAGNVDDGELGLLRAFFLGGAPLDHFATRYRVSAEDISTSLEARGAQRKEEPPKLSKLPERRAPERADLRGFVQDSLAALFPPALSRIRRSWYDTDLGVLSAQGLTLGGAEAAGQNVAYLGIRVGTPVLARLRSRSLGFGLFDDFNVLGQFGYKVSGSGDAKKTWGGGAQYTATVGFRARAFAILAGARANVNALRLAGENGTTFNIPLFGQIGIGLGRTGLAVELWGGALTGDDSRGVVAYWTVPITDGQRGQYTTSFLGFRAEEHRFDICATVEGSSCMNVPDLRIRTYALALGVAFD